MFGFLNVYKPKGKTSHDVVAVLRRIIKIKQIGHTGTLDPFAEGVLPICIGKATRLIEYLNDDKAYVGTVQLGNSTTTYDTEGEAVNFSDKKASLSETESALDLFRGEIEQLPPIYSAIKVNGKKMYEYARKGEAVEIKPRKVCINELKILGFDEEKQQVELFISCSKGTYIRSIANDLGENLGTYGHLTKLIRIKAGCFTVEDSVKIEDIDTAEKVKTKLIQPLEYLNYPKYEIDDSELARITNGNSIQITAKDGLTVLTKNSQIAAIANVEDSVAKCKKVFIS